MKYNDIQEKVIEVARLQLGCGDSEIITCDTSKDDLEWDSLDAVEFVMEVEEAFDIELPDETLEALNTVGNMVDLIDKALNFEKGE